MHLLMRLLVRFYRVYFDSSTVKTFWKVYTNAELVRSQGSEGQPAR